MRKLIWSMGVSLDGYIAGPGGEFDWAAPDDELHRFHNRQGMETGVHLYGRRMYEIMRFWETAEQDPSLNETGREWARVWKATPKIVFSRTLAEVSGTNTRLAGADAVEELTRLKEQPGKDIAVGGAGLAQTFMERDLIDEYRLFVNPVIVGGGTPYFSAVPARIDLELMETRTFGSRVVYLRYGRP